MPHSSFRVVHVAARILSESQCVCTYECEFCIQSELSSSEYFLHSVCVVALIEFHGKHEYLFY